MDAVSFEARSISWDPTEVTACRHMPAEGELERQLAVASAGKRRGNKVLELRPSMSSRSDNRWKLWLAASCIIVSTLQACTVGPDYLRPEAPEPVGYKELAGWKVATPADTADRGAWWAVFADRQLGTLLQQVEISNQTVAGALAAYDQARALIRESQAAFFPLITANYTATEAHVGTSTNSTAVARTQLTSNLNMQASWVIDVWGRVRRAVESSVAGAQVSAADLANAELSAQATLAVAYFNLRAADSLQELLGRTVAEYKRTLDITQNQFAAGTVSKADVITAQTQLLTTQAQLINVGITRAQFEHAIAVLIGRPPADLTVSKGSLANRLPNIPVSLPSTLLERRPDIAAAERLMQQQNALIGVAVAAYFPEISLSGLAGYAGRGPLSLAGAAWSLAAAASQVAFDGGLRGAQVDAARAVYDQSVASYRQTVLTAFQQVEDQLAALRILARQAKVQAEAVDAAQEQVTIQLNQYSAGTTAFTAVVIAQAQLLTNQVAALTIRQNRFIATVSLIEALGGGWETTLLPSATALEQANPLIPR
jgi:NodT family efflux transporter outer membrane factor (OMF) lipoprotein